jgi:hypothetical protein
MTAKTWSYDLNDGRVIWDSGHLDLTAHEAALFGVLDKRFPHKVPMELLILALYPESMPDADLPNDPASAVRSIKSRFRERLRVAHAPFTLSDLTPFGVCIDIEPT